MQYSLLSLLRSTAVAAVYLAVATPLARLCSTRCNLAFWSSLVSGILLTHLVAVLYVRYHSRHAQELGGKLLLRLPEPYNREQLPLWIYEGLRAGGQVILLALLTFMATGCAHQAMRDPRLPWGIVTGGMLMPGIVFGLVYGSVLARRVQAEFVERGVVQYKFPDGKAKATFFFTPWVNVRNFHSWGENLTLVTASGDILLVVPPDYAPQLNDLLRQQLAAREIKLPPITREFAIRSVQQQSAAQPAISATPAPTTTSVPSDPSSAIAWYTERIAAEPHEAKWYYKRAKAWRRLYNYDEALADLGTAIDLAPNVNAYLERANLLETLGRTEEAADDEQQAYRLQGGF